MKDAVSEPSVVTGYTEATSRLMGAAAHILGRSAEEVLAQINAQPPKVPLWKRKDLLPYVAAVLTVVAVLAVEAYTRYSAWEKQTELAQLDGEFSEKIELKKKMEAQAGVAANLQKKIADQQERLDTITQEQNALFYLDYRRQLVSGMLEAIQRAMVDEVMVEQVIQDQVGRGQIYVSGWAATDTAAQLFINNLSDEMQQWSMEVRDRKISSGGGVAGAAGIGYTLEAWFLSL